MILFEIILYILVEGIIHHLPMSFFFLQSCKEKKIKKKMNRKKNKKGKIKHNGSSDQHLKETLSPPISSSEKETKLEQNGSPDQHLTSTLASVPSRGKETTLRKKQKELPTKSPKRKKNTLKKKNIHDSERMQLNGNLSLKNGAESLEKKKNKNKTRKRKQDLEVTTKKKMKNMTKKTKITGKPDGDAVFVSDKEKQKQEKKVFTTSDKNCLEEEEVHVKSCEYRLHDFYTCNVAACFM